MAKRTDNHKLSGELRIRTWVTMALALALLVRVGSSAQVTASVDRTTVTLGDVVNLTLTFEGMNVQGQPPLPEIAGFSMDANRTSRQTVFMNGMVRNSFVYTLVAQTEGNLTIPALNFAAGNQTFATQPIPIKVVKAGSAVPGQSGNTPMAFVSLYIPRSEIYFGEVFVIEERLHYIPQGNRLAALQPNWGIFEGNLRVTPLENYADSDMVTNNQPYKVRAYRALATPLKAGRCTAGPVPLLMAFGRIDIFGQFRADQTYRLAADAVTFQILPVPTTNAPPTYSGAVGNYSMQVSAAPTEVAVGDPITVKIRLSGRGQFESLSLPSQPAWREFKTYPPSSTIATNDQIGLSCVKSFEQVVIPQNQEIKELPPFEFSFFEPQTKSFRTLKSQTIPLQVRASAGGTAPLPTLAGISNRTERAEKAPEIAPLKVHLGPVASTTAPLFQRGWFLGLQLAPPLLWLSLVARRKYAESLSRNPRLVRQRQVAKLTAEGLGQLRQQATANQQEEFFATVFRLLQEQIGERLDLPASAITEAIIEDRLRPAGVDETLLKQVHDLFQECNLARYAASRDSAELGALIPRMESALEGLKKLADLAGRSGQPGNAEGGSR